MKKKVWIDQVAIGPLFGRFRTFAESASLAKFGVLF